MKATWSAWNSIEDNVAVISYSSYGSVDDYDIVVYDDDLGSTILGKTGIYANNVAGHLAIMNDRFTGNAVRAEITLNYRLLSTLDSNWQQKVAIHELGHALALNHPSEYGCVAYAVMQQGVKGNGSSSYASSRIQSHDEMCLKAKW